MMTLHPLFKTDQQSFLVRWDPRLRLLSLMVLAFTISFISELRVLPWVVVLTLALVWLAGVSMTGLLQRLRLPSVIILGLVIFLPFASSGEVWVQVPLLGWELTHEGLAAATVIAVRFYAILTLALVFLGAAPLLEHIKGLRALGVPDLIADLALLVVRHIEVVRTDFRRMQQAMRLRGEAGTSWRSWRTLIWLTAGLLVRSHERSARVYHAMRLRGYGEESDQRPRLQASGRDLAVSLATVLIAMSLVLLELLA